VNVPWLASGNGISGSSEGTFVSEIHCEAIS